ncbi:GNAT family N-acetyltransferase [Lentzea sp. NPDC006480]|uniref:GNAT family N-acetyltransferase n=1 Tax=Lentzea sp. NPDC006480 TaxID=3157176 RepID=UPI0033B86B9E
MTVRLAEVSDAPAVASVQVQTWRTAYKGLMPDEVLDGQSVEARTSMWQRAIPNGGVWVALVDDAVVGFASAGPSRDPDAAFELYAIYVLSSAAGKGLGFELTKAALGDEPDVIVWVLDTNVQARRFYERIGFRADGVTKTEMEGTAELTEVRYRRSTP